MAWSSRGKADVIYSKVLAVAPDYFHALHLPGVTFHQAAKSDEAIRLISRVLEQNLRHPDVLNSLGAACRAGKRTKEAERYYRQANMIARSDPMLAMLRC